MLFSQWLLVIEIPGTLKRYLTLVCDRLEAIPNFELDGDKVGEKEQQDQGHEVLKHQGARWSRRLVQQAWTVQNAS